LLHFAWLDVARRFPFTAQAVCLLPEHLHCIWSLLEGDADYKKHWKEIKKLFTKGYLLKVEPGSDRSASRLKRGEAAIWQRRLWEHTIRDETDLNLHLDYIYYNPGKHGWVKNVADWPWSSFHRCVRMGHCAGDWGEMVGERVSEMRYGEQCGRGGTTQTQPTNFRSGRALRLLYTS
jgi:putative transposase